MEEKKTEFEILNRELMYKGVIIDFYKDTLRTPTGETVVWDFIKHNGAAAVVTVDEDDNLLMVSQYRNAIRKQTLEIPAGCINPGEDPMVSAKREVEEETGYEVVDIKPINKIFTALAYCNEIIHVYYAKVGKYIGQHLDDDEFVNVKKYTLEEVKKMIADGTIQDTKTISSILTYEMLFRNHR